MNEEKQNLMDIPIRDNPRVYFQAHNAFSWNMELCILSGQESVIKDLKANRNKYLAAILPGIKVCGSELPNVIGDLAKTIEFVLGFDCCTPNRGRESQRAYGESKRTIEFEHYVPTIYKPGCVPNEEEIGDYSLREVLGWYTKDLEGDERKSREEFVQRLEERLNTGN
jgi:hypothetical protein